MQSYCPISASDLHRFDKISPVPYNHKPEKSFSQVKFKAPNYTFEAYEVNKFSVSADNDKHLLSKVLKLF